MGSNVRESNTDAGGKDLSSPYPCRASLVPTNSLVKWVLEIFRKVNRPRLGLDHPPQLALRLRMNGTVPLLLSVSRSLVTERFFNLYYWRFNTNGEMRCEHRIWL